MIRYTFCRLLLDELIRRVFLPAEDCGDLRIPRNGNSIESVDTLQVRYFSFFKIHSSELDMRRILVVPLVLCTLTSVHVGPPEVSGWSSVSGLGCDLPVG